LAEILERLQHPAQGAKGLTRGSYVSGTHHAVAKPMAPDNTEGVGKMPEAQAVGNEGCHGEVRARGGSVSAPSGPPALLTRACAVMLEPLSLRRPLSSAGAGVVDAIA